MFELRDVGSWREEGAGDARVWDICGALVRAPRGAASLER